MCWCRSHSEKNYCKIVPKLPYISTYILEYYTMCIEFVYTVYSTLLKVVSNYDLNVLSMSVMDLKKLDGGWVGEVSS